MTAEMERASALASEPASAYEWQLPTGWARLRRSVETFGDLFFIQFSGVRTGWQWIFVVGGAVPLGLLIFLTFVGSSAGKPLILQFITGSVVVALMVNPLFMLSGQLAWARQSHAFDFYAGLPISRVAVILASICVSVMFTLPGTIVLLFLGMVFFHLWLVPNPLIVPIMLISPLSLAGLGAMIGVLSPNQQVSGVIANLTMVIVMYLSPVYAPMSKLPGLLQVTSHLLPPTYAADALRQTLSNQVGAGLIVDLAVLAVFSVGSLYLVTTKLDWRSR